MSEKNRGSNAHFRVLCLGDIVARPGRTLLAKRLPEIITEKGIGFVIANGENAAGGLGLDPRCAEEIFAAGVNVITLGDHTWGKKELQPHLESQSARILRPANYPKGAPGRGLTTVKAGDGTPVTVMNLMGRVFFNFALDCPFRKADELLAVPDIAKIIICDMHAEATSEKVALGCYLDGRVSAVFGTHTHVQTADEQILRGGTAYISDLGMCGSGAGVIGMDAGTATRRFLSGVPEGYKPAEGEETLRGVMIDIDPQTGKAHHITRVVYS